MPNLKNYIDTWLTGEIQPPPISGLIGFELLSAADGRSQVQLVATQQHHNPMGTVHGGIYCDLADAAMGTALASLMEPGEFFSTAALNIHFISPVREGQLTAKAQVIQRGGTIAHVECNIHDEKGDLIAKAWSTCRISSTA